MISDDNLSIAIRASFGVVVLIVVVVGVVIWWVLKKETPEKLTTAYSVVHGPRDEPSPLT